MKIERVGESRLRGLQAFYTLAIRDAFARDMLPDHPDIPSIIDKQVERAHASLQTEETLPWVWVMMDERNIAGTLAMDRPSALIRQHLPELPNHWPEITSVYADPKRLRQGIGKAMFAHALSFLNQKRFHGYCLDAGYQHSQGFWMHQLGKPTRMLSDLWGIGQHHFIWQIGLT